MWCIVKLIEFTSECWLWTPLQMADLSNSALFKRIGGILDTAMVKTICWNGVMVWRRISISEVLLSMSMFITTVYLFCDCHFPQNNVQCHKAQIISNYIHYTQMGFEITLFQFNREFWVVLEQEDLHHLHQFWSNCVMLSGQCGLKSLRSFSSTPMNQCQDKLRQFWRQKRSNLVQLKMC